MRHNLYPAYGTCIIIYTSDLHCAIVYTTLEPYMRGIISTILAYFGGLGGASPVIAGHTEPRHYVSTWILWCYSTVDEVVMIWETRARAIHRAMRHSLYTCNMLIYSKLGRGVPHAPDPRVRGAGLIGIPLYVCTNFITTHLPVSTPQIFYTVSKHR